jgi:hypothetical protein
MPATEDIRLRKERYIKLLYNKIRLFLKNLKKLIRCLILVLTTSAQDFDFLS